MRLLSFKQSQTTSWGIRLDGGLLDIGRGWMGDLGQALWQHGGEGVLARCRQILDESGGRVDFKLDEVELLPPVVRPPKIICIGVNYALRHQEYKDKPDAPRYPSVFMRTPESFVGHKQHLVRPAESGQLDYEGEITLVIGRQAHRLTRDEAMSCVLGFTLMNEGSIRDWIRHGKFNVTQGKNFRGSGSLGPHITSCDELASDAWQHMRLQTRVNGETRQDDTTDRLMFPFDSIISYLSIFMTLQPGDIIATGTPNGSGARLDPPQYLKPGDIVEVEADGLGTLSNGIVDAGGEPMETPTPRL